MNDKEYIFDKMQRQINISVMKYRKHNPTSAAAYFHCAAILGDILRDLYDVTVMDKDFYINVIQAACRCQNVDYDSYFNTMCDIAYGEG